MSRIVLLVMMTALTTTACQTTSRSASQATPTALDNNRMEFRLPTGIDAPPPIPADNPITPAKVALGRQLFFDVRLSSDRTVSCATCHNPVMGFTDGRRTSMGTRGQIGGRSAPTVINLAYATGGVFWDGRASGLEEQAKGPIKNPIEMSNTHEKAVATLNALPGYRAQFEQVFGSGEITIDNVAKAIAAFERGIISGNSPWDRFLKGDQTALSEGARSGWNLFQSKANCIRCHAGFNLTNNQFRNIGVGFDHPDPDLGRYEFTRNESDRGRFKTPTLREITFTAPYMHDGSEPTLEDVIEYYDRGGNPNPHLDSDIEPLHLSKQEKADLLAFLHSLNGEGWKMQPPIQLPPDNDSWK